MTALDALDARDVGFALAAVALEGAAAAKLARRAPRDAAGRIEAALVELEPLGPEAARASLLPRAEDLARRGAGVLLARAHPSWLAEALADEPDDVVEAVLAVLPGDVATAVRTGLARRSRAAPAGAPPVPLRLELMKGEAERFRARAFPFLGPAGALASPSTALRWLARAREAEIELVARELGVRAVARAFSGISKDDLTKLCHGLPPSDSVRLVSSVVELRDTMKPEELRPLQRTHLKLLRAGGVSPELFFETGLALLSQALLGRLDERARFAIALRIEEGLGRRLLDLSAPGAALDEATRAVFEGEVATWLGDLEKNGILSAESGAAAAERRPPVPATSGPARR